MKINKKLIIVILLLYFIGGIIISKGGLGFIASVKFALANGFIDRIEFQQVIRIIFYSILFLNSCLVLSQFLFIMIKNKTNILISVLHIIFHFSSIFIYTIYSGDIIGNIILWLIGIVTIIPIIIYYLTEFKIYIDKRKNFI